jgi:hypothetical protein
VFTARYGLFQWNLDLVSSLKGQCETEITDIKYSIATVRNLGGKVQGIVEDGEIDLWRGAGRTQTVGKSGYVM